MRKGYWAVAAAFFLMMPSIAAPQMAPKGATTPDDGKADAPGLADPKPTEAQLRSTIAKQKKYIAALEKRVKALEAQLAQRP
jgi:hypothetical protein